MKRLHWFLPPLLLAAALSAQTIIFDDTWADGGADNGSDISDTSWYKSTSNGALEVSTGSLGIVSGTSGRGIHTTFNPVDLAVGDKLEFTFSFNTPDTVGTDRTNAFRFGFFNSETSNVATDFTTSSDPSWDPISGYIVTYDVNTGEEFISVRKRLASDGTRDRFLSTTTHFELINKSVDTAFSFFDNTLYTATVSIERTGSTELTISSSISIGSTLLAQYSIADPTATKTSFDFLGIHVNSSTFGFSSDPDTADNGIDLTQATLTLTEGTGGETWRGYPVTDGFVDTGNWIGWLSVQSDPWIYAYSINGWFYLAPGNIDHGAWVYLKK